MCYCTTFKHQAKWLESQFFTLRTFLPSFQCKPTSHSYSIMLTSRLTLLHVLLSSAMSLSHACVELVTDFFRKHISSLRSTWNKLCTLHLTSNITISPLQCCARSACCRRNFSLLDATKHNQLQQL